jgi:hypothetical protein
MAAKKEVLIILILIFVLFLFSESREVNYTNLDMLYEDPLYYESWTFTRELYQNSSYIDNDKEICYFFSSNWKYENHNIFIEYIFATKNYKNLKINLYKVLINHNETESKSYKHDVEGAWKVLVFEKMEPQGKLLNNDERFSQFNKIVDKWISKGQKYKMMKVNDISFFEKINQVQELNAYICTVSLMTQNDDEKNEDNIITEDFLIEEEISSGTMYLRHVIYRNPNL